MEIRFVNENQPPETIGHIDIPEGVQNLLRNNHRFDVVPMIVDYKKDVMYVEFKIRATPDSDVPLFEEPKYAFLVDDGTWKPPGITPDTGDGVKLALDDEVTDMEFEDEYRKRHGYPPLVDP